MCKARPRGIRGLNVTKGSASVPRISNLQMCGYRPGLSTRAAAMNRAERGRKGASAGGRWRAGELLGMPGAINRPDFLDHNRRAQRDQDNDDGSRHRNGRGGVQHDAKGTVIGVGAGGVDVRDLTEGQQNQQEKAQHRGGDPEGARPGGTVPAWLECGQTLYPFSKGYTGF